MFIIVNWWTWGDSTSAHIVSDTEGENMVFYTEEEAQEFCNTELNGYYQIVRLDP